MTPLRLFQILRNNLLLLFVFPILVGSITFYYTKDEIKSYSSKTDVMTGIVSGVDLSLTESIRRGRTTQSVFDDMFSIMQTNQFLELVGLKLISQHLLQDIDSIDNRICSKKILLKLYSSLDSTLRRELTVPNNFEKTLEKVTTLFQSNKFNPIFNLIYSPYRSGFVYNIQQLKKVEYSQYRTSDILRFEHTTTDPGVCTNTLKFFAEEFIQSMREIKMRDSRKLVEFYENELRMVSNELRKKEDELLSFKIENDIINYEWQSREIAAYKQRLIDRKYIQLGEIETARTLKKYSTDRLDVYLNVINKNGAIVEKRNKLEKLISDYANVNASDDLSAIDSLNVLSIKIFNLRKELEVDLDKVLSINFSTSGIKAKELLKVWFDNSIDLNKSKANLKVFGDYEQYFNQIYDQMAPIGSLIQKMNRDVSFVEKKYLQTSGALNQARMKLEGIKLNNKIRVIEEASFPLMADPSTRKRLIIISMVVGFGLIISILLFLEVIDTSIRQPLRLKKKTDFEVAGGFTYIRRFFNKNYHQGVYDKSLNKLFNLIKFDDIPSKRIYITSMFEKEGKSYCTEKVHQFVFDQGIQSTIHQVQNMRDFKMSKSMSDDGIHFFECPSLNSFICSFDELDEKDTLLIVMDARRKWTDADTKTFEAIDQYACQPFILLNCMNKDFVIEITGKIPKKRGVIGRFIDLLLYPIR